jgi:hypothetical protein
MDNILYSMQKTEYVDIRTFFGRCMRSRYHSRVRLGLLSIDMTAAVDPCALCLLFLFAGRGFLEGSSSPFGIDCLQ